MVYAPRRYGHPVVVGGSTASLIDRKTRRSEKTTVKSYSRRKGREEDGGRGRGVIRVWRKKPKMRRGCRETRQHYSHSQSTRSAQRGVGWCAVRNLPGKQNQHLPISVLSDSGDSILSICRTHTAIGTHTPTHYTTPPSHVQTTSQRAQNFRYLHS